MLGGRVKTLHPAVHGGTYRLHHSTEFQLISSNIQEFLLEIFPPTSLISTLSKSLPSPSSSATSTRSTRLSPRSLRPLSPKLLKKSILEESLSFVLRLRITNESSFSPIPRTTTSS